MGNLLINCFFGNDTASIKKLFSSEDVISEEGKNAGDFLNFLGIRIGNGLFGEIADRSEKVGNQIIVKDTDESTSSGNTGEESTVGFSDTQSIIALLQTYLDAQKLQGMKDGAANDGQSVSMEEFLRGFLSLLQEGESVQFTGSRPVGTVFYVSELESKGETTESDGNAPVDSKETTDNRISIGYLASILQQFGVSETNGNKAEKARGYNEGATKDELKTARGKEVFRMPDNTDKNQGLIKTAGIRQDRLAGNETEISANLENESGDIFASADVTAKPVYKIEVKKLDDKENTFQIVSNESSSDNDKETNKDLSRLSIKAERTLTFSDDNVSSVIKEVSDKTTDDYSGSNARQLLSRHDLAMSHTRLSQEQGKISEHVPFSSVMTDRIEKIVEHYANKGVSADLVVRLKIDEKETLIVGLKDQGQTVAVEIKTTDESMSNFLSSQKGEITKQLEEKNVYANIYVDMENDNLQKRKQGEHNKQKNVNPEKKIKDDFNTFIETMV